MEEFSVTTAGRKITIKPMEDETFEISLDSILIGSIYANSHAGHGHEWLSSNGVHPSLIVLAGGLIEDRYM